MIRSLWALGARADRGSLVVYVTVLAVSSALIAAVLVLLVPLVRALFSQEPSRALEPAVAIAIVGSCAAAANIAMTVLGQRLGARYVLRMHDLIGDRVARLPLGWFDAERTGPISQLVTRGVPFAANAPDMMFRPLVQGVIAALAATVAALLVHPLLAGVTLVGAVAVGIAYRWSDAWATGLEHRADAAAAEASARVIEFADAQPAVRLAGPDSLAVRSVRASVREQLATGASLLRRRGIGMTVYTSLCYAALLLVVGTGAVLALVQATDAASFAALVVISVLVTWLALHSLPFGQGVQMARRTLTELEDMLRVPLLTEPVDPADPIDASIEFDKVTFRYPGDEREILRNGSFRVPGGTTTAIIGPSGAGKTTLARLIARFHDVGSGAIRIGGVDVRALGTDRVFAQLAMVFQDVYLFEGTLRENIRLGRTDADDGDIEDAAARAGVDEIAARLPGGLDSRVGEGGATLSAGERQRVSLGRALLKRAPILLLDEATAALDIESEMHVQRGLAELARGGTTMLVIAHRVSTVRHADQVVVLDGLGGIEAVGSPDDLMRDSPTFARFIAEREESAGWRIDAH